METGPVLKESDFRHIADLVYHRFGIHLSDQKRILVAGRLAKRLRDLGLDSYTQYIEVLRQDSSGAELTEFINRITTNHSYFWREKEHFEFLTRVILPELRKRLQANPNYPLRIWSAGCSTGDEVYTTAMVLRDFFGEAWGQIDGGLLATDISLAVLHEAHEAVYGEARVRELPPKYRNQWFRKLSADQYQLAPEIRDMVLFKRFNLMADQFPFKGQFDVVFCRNVMIYFDQAKRDRLVRAIYNVVKPGGYFFIGHSESLPRATCPFQYVGPAIYRKGED